jgi:DNA-binding CsgD family transcriptional regulator
MLDLPKDILRTLFARTRAEFRVALLLADGRAPREIAESVGVSFETVRPQIKSVFAKANVKRQGELIRLLLCGYREFRPYQPTSLWHANRRSRGCTFLVGKHIRV